MSPQVHPAGPGQVGAAGRGQPLGARAGGQLRGDDHRAEAALQPGWSSARNIGNTSNIVTAIQILCGALSRFTHLGEHLHVALRFRERYCIFFSSGLKSALTHFVSPPPSAILDFLS